MTHSHGFADSLNRHSIDFRLSGELGGADFDNWLRRHAEKLGVEFVMARQGTREVYVQAQGAREMVDAFALAASLGPNTVCIEDLTFLENG